jgi:hypothetical protein
MTDEAEYNEAESDYEQGLEQGYCYAVECWEDDKALPGSSLPDREGLACLLYRQPRQMLNEHIYDHHKDFGLDDNYVRGFAQGMRNALDERNANGWLTSLPGYS